MAFQALRRPYNTDVGPIVAKARAEAGGAMDVLGAYRESRWRNARRRSARPWGLARGSCDQCDRFGKGQHGGNQFGEQGQGLCYCGHTGACRGLGRVSWRRRPAQPGAGAGLARGQLRRAVRGSSSTMSRSPAPKCSPPISRCPAHSCPISPASDKARKSPVCLPSAASPELSAQNRAPTSASRSGCRARGGTGASPGSASAALPGRSAITKWSWR